jgi:hypothetical protein
LIQQAKKKYIQKLRVSTQFYIDHKFYGSQEKNILFSMKKLTALSSFILLLLASSFCFCNDHDAKPATTNKPADNKLLAARLKNKAASLKKFAQQNNYNSSIGFLVDMRLPSGKKRFFVYDLQQDSILFSGLIAHGNCNSGFLAEAKFSNTPDCGCSSLGRYSVGYKYSGKFGEAFKLYGLDSSNSNAFNRYIVLHGYGEVPDKESDDPICNSLGCPMVSHPFLAELDRQISKVKKPILLWMFQ